jgi:hypothetical protein
MSYFTSMKDSEPSEEGSKEDSDKQREQRARQTGSPNADWPAQRRFYDRQINRQVGLPIEPPEAFRNRKDDE